IAFVVRPDRPIARVELGPLAPIRAAIDAWRPILRLEQPAPQDEPSGPAAQLQRLVWSPLEEHLTGVATVLVSPDGALGLVPLQALPGKAAGSYLIEDYTIALVPVPRLFGDGEAVAAEGPKPATAQAEAPSLLLVGDVDYGGDPGVAPTLVASRSAARDARADFAPLFERREGMRVEVSAIRDSFEEQFPGTQATLLRGGKATEEALRQMAGKYRYLHLATHGYFAPPELRSALGPSDPAARLGTDLFGARGVAGFHPGLLSGLALAGANVRPTPSGRDDGILTALEVAELDLAKVQLAVLSACETGLGEVAGGEGLLGLQRAFQVAGARAVVASLWTVPDISTQNLMARFYENLWRKGLPPRVALRAAQLEMLREGYRRGIVPLPADASKPERVPPYYWAAFVLSTDRL
ncbi:MAG TPA: CHAT domain-containing protein, partial [Isosphaeraceae bacterium]|nr:CHAT domain-containing protein [Isosphaeraceae bacterium]